MKLNPILISASFIAAFQLNLGCNSNSDSSGSLSHLTSSAGSNYSEFPAENLNNSLSNLTQNKSARLDLSLTDAPNKDLSSVVVDIDHVEALLSKGGKGSRLILNQGLGPIDLLKLQNGITLGLSQVQIPAGVQIQQLRLVLKGTGHFAVKSNGSICQLQTPSAQKTGLKIILTNQFTFESGAIYKVLIDFDALKSVVVKGNGECLLKPVIKIKSASKIISDLTPDDTETDSDTTIDDIPIIVNDDPAIDTGGSDAGTGETPGTEEGSSTPPSSPPPTTTDDSVFVGPLDPFSDYTELDLLELNEYYNTQP